MKTPFLIDPFFWGEENFIISARTNKTPEEFEPGAAFPGSLGSPGCFTAQLFGLYQCSNNMSNLAGYWYNGPEPLKK